MLLSQLATDRIDADTGEALEASFVDIRKAYLNAVPRRSVHPMFPREVVLEKHKTAKLKRCVYGTRDAGQLWEDCYAQKLIDTCFVRGVSSPCCFDHPERNIRVVVHGDDCAALGTATQLQWYEQGLASAFEIKIMRRLGESPSWNRRPSAAKMMVLQLPPGAWTYS